MLAAILVRYLHFICLLALASSIFGQFLLLRPRPRLRRSEVVRLARLDQIYAAAVIGVLATGLLQWFLVGKGAAFYSHNPVFHTKLGLFGLIGIVSIYPTLFFAKQRKGNEADELAVSPWLIWSVRIELLLLLAMPLLATLMARGIGNA